MTLAVLILAALLLVTGESAGQGSSRRRSPQSSQQQQTSSSSGGHLVDFDCPEEFGYYAHPTDCTQYYVCVFGGALLESCTGGLMYSHELQTCDWPRNVGCAPGTGNPVQVIQQQQEERPVPQRQQQSERSRVPHSRLQAQQQIPKHDLYTEEDPLPEELDPDRQQRVYRGQPQTIGQVQSDRDGLSTHSNAIPVPSGGRDKLSVVSYGTQQQYTSHPDGRRHPFDDRPVSWSSFQPRILNSRRPPHFLPPAPPPTLPSPNNHFANRPFDIRFELSDARATPGPSAVPHITVHASYTAPPYHAASFTPTYHPISSLMPSPPPTHYTTPRLETLRPPPPTTKVYSYSERPALVHLLKPAPLIPPKSQSPKPPSKQNVRAPVVPDDDEDYENDDYEEDYDESEEENKSDQSGSVSSAENNPKFPDPPRDFTKDSTTATVPREHHRHNPFGNQNFNFNKFLSDLRSEVVDSSKTTPRPMDKTTKRFKLSEMYRPVSTHRTTSTTERPSGESEEYDDNGGEEEDDDEYYDDYDDSVKNSSLTSRPKSPKVPKKLQNISNQADDESEEGSYEDYENDDYYDSREVDSDEDTHTQKLSSSTTLSFSSTTPSYTIPSMCPKGRCPPKRHPSTSSTVPRPTSRPRYRSPRPTHAYHSSSSKSSTVIADAKRHSHRPTTPALVTTTTKTTTASSNLTTTGTTHHKKLRQSLPRYANGKKLFSGGSNLLSVTKNTNSFNNVKDKGNTQRAINRMRASHAPQQTYVEQQQTTPTRSYNQTRYVASQYDPPPFYSLYDEDVDIYKETGDYNQYNTQTNNNQYRGQTVSYKDKKPQIEIIQQEPLQRSPAYAKNKYNAQSDIYQSVTPQEYDSYSIQTNDDIPYRQTQQTKTSSRFEVKESEDSGKKDESSAKPTNKMVIQQTLDSTTQTTTVIPLQTYSPPVPSLTFHSPSNTPRPFSLPDPEPVSMITRSEFTVREPEPLVSITPKIRQTTNNNNEQRVRNIAIRVPQASIDNNQHHEDRVKPQRPAPIRASESAEWNGFRVNTGGGDYNHQDEYTKVPPGSRGRSRYHESIYDGEFQEDAKVPNARNHPDAVTFSEEAEKRARSRVDEARNKANEQARLRQIEQAEAQAKEEVNRRRLAAQEKLKKEAEEELNRKHELEVARRQQIEQAEKRAAFEVARKKQLEESQRRAAFEVARKKQAEEDERRAELAEFERMKQIEEEMLARRKEIEEYEYRAAVEAARKKELKEKQQKEAERKAALEEERRKQQEEEERRAALEEARKRQIALDAIRKKEIEEAEKKAALEAAKKKQLEEDALREAQRRQEAERRAAYEAARRREAEEVERLARKKQAEEAAEAARRRQAEENERRSLIEAAKRRQAAEEAQRRALVEEAKRKQETQQSVALSREEAEHRAREELALRPTDARRKLSDNAHIRAEDANSRLGNPSSFRVVVNSRTAPPPQSFSPESRPPKKYLSRNSSLVNEPYLNEQSTPFYPTTNTEPPARTYTDNARKTLDTPIPISKVNSENNEKIVRGRLTSYDTQSTPGSSSRGNSRHRGSQTYTASPNEAEPAPASNRGTPASSRGRPTLKPSTTIVSKASEFVDIYKYPPQRPANIYPTPQVDKTAAKCRKDVCLLPDCSCGGKDVPGDLPLEETPQIVLLTFDDSVNDLNKGLYSDLFEKGRVNPNGCPISATFYVSHEWTDYSQVQNLYSSGHEIASHSVSHSFGEQFSVKKWTREISGQREILAAYGGVRMEDIRGMRAPFLAVGGNKMFKMLYDSNFTYDSSMPVYENKPPSWPYTMDYKIFHDCMIPPCPSRSYPGVWEVPMVMWQDLNGGRCSMGDACSNPPNAEGVYKMLVKNFERHFTSNRAPFGLFYHAAWFTQPHHKEGFIAFLDTINKMPEVWVVTNWQAIQWVRDPTPISRVNNFAPFQCNYPERPKKCNNPKVCNLWHKSGVRYMRTCQPCPDVYPWTGNSGVRNSRVDNEIINE